MIAFMSQMVSVVDNCIFCNYFGLSLAEEGKNLVWFWDSTQYFIGLTEGLIISRV